MATTNVNPIQPPGSTDIINDLAARVTALESAQYDDDLPVDVFRLFDEEPLVTDVCTVSIHTYRLCSPNIICSPSLIV